MRNDADHLIEIGVVGRPHGTGGTLRVFLHNPSSPLLFNVDSVHVQMGDNPPREYGVLHFQEGGKHGLLVLEGVRGREAADTLKGAKLLISEDTLPDLDGDEFYIKDLIGLPVFYDGDQVGKVESSRDRGGVEVVAVRQGDVEFEVPLVEDYVVELDIAASKLVVREIEHLPRTQVKARPPKSPANGK